jgi:hypothetical protein
LKGVEFNGKIHETPAVGDDHGGVDANLQLTNIFGVLCELQQSVEAHFNHQTRRVCPMDAFSFA